MLTSGGGLGEGSVTSGEGTGGGSGAKGREGDKDNAGYIIAAFCWLF